ncbi:MAG: glycogen/starch/alpha-glucan phosphorylase [Chlamydiales bacterium]|jgi:starch phosphorylase|nr:glycogen/starch/alpha-glucan phosphorylase [Chlamydiales bacterium]
MEKPSKESFKKSVLDHLLFTLAKDPSTATKRDYYLAMAHAIRDLLVARWIETQKNYYKKDAKRVYYLSLEFLIGRTMGNSLINLDILPIAQEALKELGIDIEEVREMEWDAGLGNGGLGRLAACFLDSLATLQLPGYGYGIRYEYGIFAQKIKDGYQQEVPDNWLRYGNPWEIARPEYLYPVRFYGRLEQKTDSEGKTEMEWVDSQDVMAMAYDTPIPGYKNDTVNTLRLWAAKSSREFELNYFNHGDYIRAVEEKNRTENISRVLYPNDEQIEGKILRLKQEYFLVSSTLQDILRRHKKKHGSCKNLGDQCAIQLNDTHPALVIPELMRLLTDQEKLSWDEAFAVTRATCNYTNHTIMPEALEKWPLSIFGNLLPKHLHIIYQINDHFLKEVAERFPNDPNLLSRISLIEESDDKRVRMAYLAIVGSQKVNGVSALHSELIKKDVFPDFYMLYPERFINKTNGITPRRWLKKANRGLSELITRAIGSEWITDLSQLSKLLPLQDDASFQKEWMEIKQKNKERLVHYLKKTQHADINPNSLFDCQIKRIHEYKRQLLNIMHVIHLYLEIKNNPNATHIPRSVFIGGKAAPGYYMAKLIIKLANSIAQVINNDPAVGGRLNLLFLENYCVSQAEKVIPAADLSEQISTAGTEASGTGNMKFALNGALTIGTLDGANIEILQEVGADNIFIFGLKSDEAAKLKSNYRPLEIYQQEPLIRRVLDMIGSGYFCPEQPDLFKPIFDSLVHGGDRYLLLADFKSYIEKQKQVEQVYQDKTLWAKKSIVNVANMGFFSSDRTIKEYADEIWHAKPVSL